jgi:hypothetical protein
MGRLNERFIEDELERCMITRRINDEKYKK